MRILITGAHFTPAVAVIEELQKYPDTKIIYVGREFTMEGDNSQSVESQVLPSMGVKYTAIITGRLQRSFTVYTIPSLLRIPIGFLQSLYIMLTEKPDVILSFGGYVSVPVVISGWLWSIPIIIHEQTLVSGLANRISAIFADKIALSFNHSKTEDGKTIVTGNPIRSMITRAGNSVKRKEKFPTILITGGNQGSHTINQTVEESLEKITKIASVIHVTGDNKFFDFERLSKIKNVNYLVKKWIGEDYGTVLSKADLVISRAGANTLTELAFLGKPAIVIPFEPLYKDEQNKNAKFFENLGLVKILPQNKLTSESLLKNIRSCLNDLDSLKKSAKRARNVSMPNAAKRLALETILLA